MESGRRTFGNTHFFVLSTPPWLEATPQQSPSVRNVNELALVWVHGGPGTGTVKEKVEPDLDLELFWNRFLGSGTGTRTIYGTGLDPGPGLGRE